MLVVICVITDWTIGLIVINAKLSGRSSYFDIMHRCFGSSGGAAVSFFQFAFAFGGMCAYGIIIGTPTVRSLPVRNGSQFCFR
jgi:solute carrier family 38 (sodium-coupled neutral amino acid transporter), member 11